LSQDPERMKALISFKKRLEDNLEKLQAETTEIKAALDTVNLMLLEKGFRRGDIKEIPEATAPQEVILPKQPAEQPKEAKPVPITVQSAEREPVIPLKTMNEENLAIIYFDKNLAMHVLPDESKHFSVNTPPFQNFLVDKVLVKMRDKDHEMVHTGEIAAEKAFTFNVVCEEDLIREIIVRNVDEERLKELKSSIRWTFEKMYEKIKS
jgi:hypothetical protein